MAISLSTDLKLLQNISILRTSTDIPNIKTFTDQEGRKVHKLTRAHKKACSLNMPLRKCARRHSKILTCDTVTKTGITRWWGCRVELAWVWFTITLASRWYHLQQPQLQGKSQRSGNMPFIFTVEWNSHIWKCLWSPPTHHRWSLSPPFGAVPTHLFWLFILRQGLAKLYRLALTSL